MAILGQLLAPLPAIFWYDQTIGLRHRRFYGEKKKIFTIFILLFRYQIGINARAVCCPWYDTFNDFRDGLTAYLCGARGGDRINDPLFAE
ncbi:hypothetical protein PCO86_19125 [Pectobacteriaceae bacterium CE70]|nr:MULTISPECIES: hypothetical protein [Enterobacterales]WJV57753.1 hypothetical protein PCO84_19860 [Pectobacteriaceae bacterium C111]WJV62072.1 hypothetical protein PCO87_19885 [Pectobacteriaceae bacterium C52]WJV66348.1 hypothetical protein PCO86_19125 [Pectobacteriaceae bacterium CE70]WJY10354.1 hypothetical protein PCO80_19085 [Pectobacteriaceae bacterium C80]WJV53392.1 hypothetical protein PCO85_19880 [Prodigiosinella sp. LS101]